MQSCGHVEGGGVPLLITIMAGNKSAQKGESAGEDERPAKTAVVYGPDMMPREEQVIDLRTSDARLSHTHLIKF